MGESRARPLFAERRSRVALEPAEQPYVLSAQLRVTRAGLLRLLNVTAAETDFILSSPKSSVTLRVGLSVSAVPDSELVLGSSGATLDWATGAICCNGNRVTLTRMELRLLVALLEAAPQPASRRDLVATLWQDGKTRQKQRAAALPVWICTLRRRLAAAGLPDAIRTVRRHGYSLEI